MQKLLQMKYPLSSETYLLNLLHRIFFNKEKNILRWVLKKIEINVILFFPKMTSQDESIFYS